MGNTPESNIDPNGLSPRRPDNFASVPFAAQAVGGNPSGASSGSGGGGNPLNASLWENTIMNGFLNGSTAFQHEVEANIAQQNTYSMMNQVLGEIGSKYLVGSDGNWKGGNGYQTGGADPDLPNGTEIVWHGSSRRRWRGQNYERGTNGSLFDERGRELLGRWLNGSGEPLSTVDGKWGDYMKANTILYAKINRLLSADAATRTQGGPYSFKGQAEIQNDYTTGYEMLHGTDVHAGGFQMNGFATMVSGGVLYTLAISWHDIIDPNGKYDTDKLLSNWLNKFYTPKDYKVHIYLIDYIKILKQ